MIKIERQLNLKSYIFFYSTKHQVNLRCLKVTSKGKKLSILRTIFKECKDLENRLPLKDSNYLKLLDQAKKKAYLNRYDCERINTKGLKSIINDCLELEFITKASIAESIDLLLNGYGTSKQNNANKLQAIIAKDKILKIYKEFSALLNEHY